MGVDGRGCEILVLALFAVRQSQERRDAAAAEQLGRCAAGRFYPSHRYTFDEAEPFAYSSVGGRTTTDACLNLVTPPAPAV
jgi:hypothetical protein